MRAARSFPLLIIVLLALAVRLVAAFGVNEYLAGTDRQFLIEGDANGYWDLATDLQAGRDYAYHMPPRRILRMPGLPVLLASSICLFGESIPAARYVLAVIGAMACWLTYLLGRRLVDRRVALVAAGITAVSPLLVGNSVLVLSEGPFSTAMLVSLLALEKLLRSSRERQVRMRQIVGASVITGLSIAVAAYLRPGWLPWALIAAGAAAVGSKQSLSWRLASPAVLLLTVVVALIPWGIRNHAVSGHLVLTTLWSGPSLYDGLNAEATGVSDMDFVDRDGVYGRLSEYDADRFYRDAAWDFAFHNKGRTGMLALRKLGRVWNPVPAVIPPEYAAVRWVLGVLYIAFFGLTLRGLWGLRRNGRVVFFVLAPVLLTCALHMVFVGSVRYRLPLEFLLCLPVAAAIVAPCGSPRREPSTVA